MGDVLPPKRQTVVERLKRRFDLYRRHQNACLPRYEQAENGIYETQRQETLLLKQRYLESKAKKAKSNKSDHHRTYKESVTDGGKSTNHPKPLKRPADSPIPNPSADCGNSEDSEKPAKLIRTDIAQDKLSDLKTQPPSLSNFSVQLVQQFSKPPHSQQSKQPIQTNVNIQSLNKPLTSPVPQGATNNQSQDNVCNSQDNQQGNVLLGTVECKQEKDCNQTDICQFKGGQTSNSDRLSDTFPSLGFTDDSGDDVIHPDLLKDLLDDVFTNSGDIMKDFNFDDSVESMKDPEDPTKDIIGDLMKDSSAMQLRPFQTENLFVNTPVSLQQQQIQQHQHMQQQQQNNMFKNITGGEVPITPTVTSAATPSTTTSNFYNTASQRLPSYGSSPLSIPNGLNLDFKLSEPSPAALTLKQMAEQHQSMQQKQQQQQFVNSPLTNRPSPFNSDSYNSHMNNLRTTNNYIPGTNPVLSSSSPKTPNSNNMFTAFERQINMNNFTTNQSLNNIPPNNQSMNSLSANSNLNNLSANGQSMNNIPSSNQPLNNLPTNNQTANNLPTSNQSLNNMPASSQQLNNMPISPNNIFDADIHSRTSNVLNEVDRVKQPGCQTLQQQQQQKPPAYVSSRPLTHFSENQQVRLQNPVGNQHQRPVGRQFQNSMQMAQTSQMHANQGHLNPQQLQPNTHDLKQQQQQHMLHQPHTYVSFSAQQPVNNPTFHVSMSYSPQFTSSQTISRPPPEYKSHHPNLSVDNVNLIEQLNSPSHVMYNNPSKNNSNNKFARHQKPPNVTITPDGTAISSNWRHMMTDQQNNQYKISNFQNSCGNFVRNEQQAAIQQQQSQLFNQYRMPNNNQMSSNRIVRPNLVPNQMLMQQRQRATVQQQRARNPQEIEQQHSTMLMTNNVISGLSSSYSNHPDISRADGNQINLDFLDNIESSASDLLNFDQVMQSSGTHFPLLDDMEILGK